MEKGLTRGKILARLGELWELLAVNGKELDSEERGKLDYTIELVKVYNDLERNKDGESVRVMGFEVGGGNE